VRLPFIRTTSLGHEVLHNWWGNGVYVDWERGNWCEGLTTFMADYAYKEEEGESAAREMRLVLGDLAVVERVQRVGGGQLVDGVSLHRSSSWIASWSSSRNRARPAKMRLLIVPSGTPSRSASSLCVKPP